MSKVVLGTLVPGLDSLLTPVCLAWPCGMFPGEFHILSERGLNGLLSLFNKVWKGGGGAFEAITSTLHICKLMERVVHERLMHFLEKKGLGG